MGFVEDIPAATPAARPARRPFHKRVMHVVRRGHLYFGLFLFPWAILYGVTAFLFNHPTVFADQPTTAYDREATAGTPLDGAPSPAAVAEQVVAKLNETQTPLTPYKLAGEARYDREFAFATVKVEGHSVNVLYDVKAGGGTVRMTPKVEKVEPEKAPFATGTAKAPGGREKGGGQKGARGPGAPAGAGGDGVKLPDQLHERFKAAVPTILERAGFPAGEVTVTSVPDIVFPVEADGRTWTASYNPLTGSVGGVAAGAKPPTEISWRRFLTRLHTTHVYPGEPNAKWFWAVVVDVMAFTMCFWGLSGLVMWWQIKGTRRAGAVVIALSAAAAAALGVAMHGALAG
ncbi:MAG TPA: PepSY-associated TM helix domain-containing protein [Urbifossiella sp.]|jgi:hypothetical protein|nr:PepSY-associated TM helix domain-containing protein [Urbifossiella sp.]